jgi:predicted outer membrane repeat protein
VFEGFTVMNGYRSEAGAIDIQSTLGGEITISRCRFINNNGGYGGAIRCQLLGYETYVISECVFDGNYSEYYGGGIFLERHLNPDGLCRIVDCTFLRNYAYYGAALAEWLYELPLKAIATQDVGTHMTGCTVASNWGACSFFGTAMSGERLIIAYNETATPFANSLPVLSCSNVYGNAGGDWIGVLASQYRVRGNIRACPSFCSMPLADFHLCDESPCLPGNHPDDYDCGLIGALGVGCSCGPSATRSTTWSAIKTTYR